MSLARAGAHSPGLTFVHSHAATSDFAMQALLFQGIREEWLVRESDLLIEVNNENQLNESELLLQLNESEPHQQTIFEHHDLQDHEKVR